jgi:hypothetical protein
MVGLVLHAVDGTRIEAVDSTARACRGKHLRKTLQKVDRYIQELEEAIERRQQEETGSYSLPEQLRDRRRLRQRILEELEKAEQDQPVSDARIQKIGGKKLLGFNAQAMVDSESQLIVAEEVVSDETDFKQLGPLLDQTEENVGAVAEDTVADRGYRSDRGIAEAQEKGQSVLVKLYEEEINPGPYHWTRFEYDPDKDVCVCPRGEVLTRVGGYWCKRRELETRTYRCRVWKECPVASQCSRDPRGRKVRLTELQPYILAQQARQRKAENQVKLRRRKEIVERSFAEIKQHMGFRRWSYREIEGVQTQWAMICTAYNLKRLLKIWAEGRQKWAVA